jgi:hypothetical protein
MTNTFSPDLSPLAPPDADDVPAAVEVPVPAADVAAAEDVAGAEALDDELPDEPQAVRLTAAVMATRAGPDQRERRVREGCASV